MTIVTELLTSISKLEDTLLKIDVPENKLRSIKKEIDQLTLSLSPPQTSRTENNTSLSSSDTIHVWTDGACSGNPGKGGWGAVIQATDTFLEFSGYSAQTTNNIMEMTAVVEALKRTEPGSTVILTTDSQYVIKGITQWIHGWKKRGWKKSDGKAVLNKELWIEIDKQTHQRNITWKWIKGHAGHPENERCDELAREAIKLQCGI